jgi:pimeloyl-ACP methyl ester carboxylesterase
MTRLASMLAGLCVLAASVSHGQGSEAPEPIQSLREDRIETAAGPRDVQRGVLRAPRFHDEPGRGRFEIPFLRFRSDADVPGPPTFLLAGGPGSTYRDDLEDNDFQRWLDGFLAFGDVVLLEQRGSRTTPGALDCVVSADVDPATPITPAYYRTLLSDALSECADRYRREGVPLEAFTIVEMARDFQLLRDALGYEQINLVGGSFGSQLGFTILRLDEDSVHRAIFYGVEGPGNTIDEPEMVDRHIDRVGQAVDENWQFRLVAGRFRPALARLIERLESEPIRGTMSTDTGEKAVTVGAFDLKLMLWSREGMKGYRENIARVAQLLAVTRLGQHGYLLEAKAELVEALSGENAFELNLMTFLVDCSSLPRSAHEFPERDPTHLFGPEIVDSELRAVCAALDLPVIASDMRSTVQAEPPMLLISGGLDGFTPPDYARAALNGLPNAHLLDVPAGDHDGWAALERDPAHVQAALDFLAGREPADRLPARIDLPPLRVRLIPDWAVFVGLAVVVGLIGLGWRRARRRRRAGDGR